MAVIDVLLPQFGMGMTDGEITKWRKQVGDQLTEGELLAEVEAAKATNEILAPCTGKLVEIIVNEGEIAQVRDVIARMDQ
jgi:pyruvate/2-oxoglutarate dehydrogenase complex dihydrolipoamide acyltransferase (E2) component